MAVNRTELTTWDMGVAIKRNNPLPLDSTENQSSKEALEEYAKGNGERGAVSYVGLIVKVVEDDTVTGCYIIKNTLGELIELSTKSLLNDAISGLGPVFTFKGVATAIDPDRSTLTVGSGTIGIPAGNSPEKQETLISYGTILGRDEDDIMYAWGSGDGIKFYTKELITVYNSDTLAQYSKEEDTTLEYIIIYDDEYFFKGNLTVEEKAFTIWESLGGDTLYSLPNGSNIDVYVTTSSDAPLVSEIKILTYTYPEFNVLDTKYKLTIYSDLESISSSSLNNGHVYQLGEEEYASNGLMWVQLGSPKNDWIVL